MASVETLLNMIKDFLDNQKQTVVINGINPDEVPVSSGVPQGLVHWEKMRDMQFNPYKC